MGKAFGELLGELLASTALLLDRRHVLPGGSAKLGVPANTDSWGVASHVTLTQRGESLKNAVVSLFAVDSLFAAQKNKRRALKMKNNILTRWACEVLALFTSSLPPTGANVKSR